MKSKYNQSKKLSLPWKDKEIQRKNKMCCYGGLSGEL